MDSLIALGCSYYLLHLLRVVEVIVGSNQYASVLLTLFCFLLPVKYALIHFSVGSNGFFFLTAGLTAYYMRICSCRFQCQVPFLQADWTVFRSWTAFRFLPSSSVRSFSFWAHLALATRFWRLFCRMESCFSFSLAFWTPFRSSDVLRSSLGCCLYRILWCGGCNT